MAVVRGARRFGEELLGDLGLPMRKAMDLSTPKGFDRAVAGMAAELRKAASSSDRDAVRAAVAVLDIDWQQTTAPQRRTLVARALEAAGRRVAGVPARVSVVFGDAAQEVVAATRGHARRSQGLRIAADFNALDRRITRHVVRTQANFVRDEYGRRLDGLGDEARRVVAEGLEAGLGRADIAADLQRAAEHALVTRPAFYWEVVAGAFVSNGRSLAQVSAFAEAGIQRYVITAVLDEVTTETCRFLDGKTFSVGDALGRFDRIERMEQPEDIKAEQPWVREAVDPETGRKVLYVDRGGVRTPIAEVVRSGLGSSDDRGEFARGRSERDLMDLGVGFPPYHGLCRTSLLPDI
ncbi:MAG: head morphogenesis protein [Myxococcales bacterium]|nr:head morphogenesis protein [Myxococcales bacterium]